jgi:hypothetical protein
LYLLNKPTQFILEWQLEVEAEVAGWQQPRQSQFEPNFPATSRLSFLPHFL